MKQCIENFKLFLEKQVGSWIQELQNWSEIDFIERLIVTIDVRRYASPSLTSSQKSTFYFAEFFPAYFCSILLMDKFDERANEQRKKEK